MHKQPLPRNPVPFQTRGVRHPPHDQKPVKEPSDDVHRVRSWSSASPTPPQNRPQATDEGLLQGFRLSDRVRIVSPTKPFRGMVGEICAIEQERWRIAPYWLYRVELLGGVVSYEYSELQLISRGDRAETR